MREPSTDPSSVAMSDVLCDVCVREAHRRLELKRRDERVGAPRSPLSLEERSEPCWRSPARPEAFACRRCVLMAAKALARDRESGWKRPTAEGAT